MLATPKGVPTPPPQGQNSVFTPYGGFLPQKRKTCDSPGFAKPWADQCLNPPALLTAMDAPQAFGVVGDFSAWGAEEVPLLSVLQFSTSSLGFWGAEPPVFRRIFALCPAFQRRVGYLPYPREEKGTQGRQRRLLVLHSGGVYCSRSVFPVTKRDFPSAATTFRIPFQFHSRGRKVICNTCAATTKLLP